jgi:hypothetical protein
MPEHLAEKFWMVWNPSGRAPTYRHPTKASALDEARRLAESNVGQHFFVLKAVGGAFAISGPAQIGEIRMVNDEREAQRERDAKIADEYCLGQPCSRAGHRPRQSSSLPSV